MASQQEVEKEGRLEKPGVPSAANIFNQIASGEPPSPKVRKRRATRLAKETSDIGAEGDGGNFANIIDAVEELNESGEQVDGGDAEFGERAGGADEGSGGEEEECEEHKGEHVEEAAVIVDDSAIEISGGNNSGGGTGTKEKDSSSTDLGYVYPISNFGPNLQTGSEYATLLASLVERGAVRQEALTVQVE